MVPPRVCLFRGTTHTSTHILRCVTQDVALFLMWFFTVSEFLCCAWETKNSAYILSAQTPETLTSLCDVNMFVKEDLEKNSFTLFDNVSVTNFCFCQSTASTEARCGALLSCLLVILLKHSSSKDTSMFQTLAALLTSRQSQQCKWFWEKKR